jgi:S-formylglutathione hydrolase FrmB
MDFARTSLLAAIALAGCVQDNTDTTEAEPVTVSSSNGITVTGTRWITPRTLEADISTPLVDPSTINGPHRVRITFPEGYESSIDSYPVVYLLHGGAGGNSAQWTEGGGAAEDISAGHPVIVVMPDGGKVGWFTNWVIDTPRQDWAEFYLTQLIPWVDANLRTVATKDGRAIAGLSMGGYGAVRLAEDAPDLFGAVGSFSGAVDLGDWGTRFVVMEQSIQNLLPPFGAFGPPFPGFDTAWKNESPPARASALAGMNVVLYAGSGTSDVDVLERTMGNSANTFHHALDAAGVPHMFWMYGRPGPLSPFGCDGGHNFSCWNYAFNDALPRLLSGLQLPDVAPGTDIAANGEFDRGLASWTCYGPCGVDQGAGLSHSGANNAWVRSDTGWNDLHQIIDVVPNRSYTLTGWVRTSAVANGYFGVRTEDGTVIGEQHFDALGDYTQLAVTVNSGPNRELVVYGGFWADGDTYLQLDDVTITAN